MRETINTKKNVHIIFQIQNHNKNQCPIFNHPINTYFVINVSYTSSKWVKITTNRYNNKLLFATISERL